MSILETIHNHEELAALPEERLPELAAEIRKRLVEVVSARGGHLAANLGVVELTVALERCFDAAKDRIIWDVGHQTYVHKILTGRNKEFEDLRQFGKMSGFPSPADSPCDAYISGHAGNALSVAAGMAYGYKLAGRKEKIIAVVGDAALACGISLEALNHAAATGGNMLMILNDNSMAIAPSVGGVSTHLTRLITGKRYNKFKLAIKRMLGAESGISHFISRLKELLKCGMLPASIFESLGIRYFGPIDGHDIKELERTFYALKDIDYPVILHVVTSKGKGYPPAENNPEKFHGVGAFDPASGKISAKKADDYSAVFGKKLTELARRNNNVCAITAGMPGGTGLSGFAEEFPERFFDVGIAEEHGAVFAGGLAAAGMKPVMAVYSSFLQRAFDCLFQDISLAEQSVVVAIDRAGIVEDGPTHHGLRDIALLRTLKNFMILAPASGQELELMLEYAVNAANPVAVRYPRGVPSAVMPSPSPLQCGKAELLADGDDCAIWALGSECARALEVRDMLLKNGITARVVNTRFIAPFDVGYATECMKMMPVFTMEDHLLSGGLYSVMREIETVKNCTVYGFGWKDDPGHGNGELLRRASGLDTAAIAAEIMAKLGR